MTTDPGNEIPMRRRKFLQLSAATVGAVGTLSSASGEPADGAAPQASTSRKSRSNRRPSRPFNSAYSGEFLNQLAFPMGGIGAGMICLEGSGALSNVSLRNRPEVCNEPCLFAAISIKGKPGAARILEGPVPARKIFGPPGTGNGAAI